MRRTVRAALTAAAAAVTLGITAAPASAWPTPLTPEQQRMIAAARGAGFPGDDDTIMMAGSQACRGLYTGQGAQATTDQIAGQYGATPQQAAGLVGAARSAICTQAPG